MLNTLHHAFIDEFGDPSIETEKKGVSNFFIIATTLVSDSSLAKVEADVKEIQEKHFQGSEIKSSKVGKNDARRIKILRDINRIDAKFYSIAVDKAQIFKHSGLRYKKSFFKFINGLLYKKIFAVFPDIRAIADDHGHPEFRESFEKYIRKNHIPNLFYKPTFDVGNSKNVPLIQISDFIAGTLARMIDPTKLSDQATNFLKLIDDQLIGVDEWPIKPRSYTGKVSASYDTKYDEAIRQLSVNQAAIFIETNTSSNDGQITDQIEVLKYLLYHFKFINPHDFIIGEKLLELCRYGNTKHYLHSAIIAKMRDEGVIISTSNKGYKIPANSGDLFEYVERLHTQVLPMLKRLDKASKKVQLATKNEINILADEKYKYLRSALKALNSKS